MKKRLAILLPFGLACTVLLFVGGPEANSLRSYRYAWGTGHLLCFAVWANLYALWRKDAGLLRLLIESLILSVFFGGLTELIQQGIGRQGSWLDLGNDVIGCFVGLLFFSDQRKSLSQPILKSLQIPAIVLLLWGFYPTSKAIVDDFWARQQFPLLSGFETPLEKTRWRGSARRQVSHDFSFSGSASLKVRLSTQRYSGLGLKDFPGDWHRYRSLEVQVYNPDSEPLQLHLRIHDQLHDNSYSDRYNTSYQLHQGWNSLVVDLARVQNAPKERELDLSRVAGLGLFVGKLERARIIYVDDVRLIP